MDKSKEHNSDLAMNTLDNIPNPNSNAKNITAVVKHSGEITGYKLSDGNVISKEENTIKFGNNLPDDELIKQLSKYKIDRILIEEATLEDMFLHYYK